MITKHELEHRLGMAQRALAHHDQARHPARGRSLERITAAHQDLVVVLAGATLTKAHAHLVEHQAGYSTNSMPEPSGRGGVSDRTGETVVAPFKDPDDDADHARIDLVTAEVGDLDTCSARLEHDAIHLLCSGDVARLSRRVEEDASRIRWVVKRWAREPDMRWCRHCWATNRHREPVAIGKYRDLCRGCGDWRRVNKILPPSDLLTYLQTRKPVPQRLMAKHRAKLPRPSGRTGDRK